MLDGERTVVRAFSNAIRTLRPKRAAHALQTPLTMLLFGMMNWMFTCLQPDGTLNHVDMLPLVAELFFGVLGAVRPALHWQCPRRVK